MWAPGIAALIVMRFVMKKPLRTLGLRRLGEKRAYLWAWLLPIGLTLATGVLTYLFTPGALDLSFPAFRQAMAAAPSGSALPTGLIVAIQIAFSITLAPLLNTVFALGEELGWRGFLLPSLLPLGQWRAILMSGVIWGIWHAPAILQGHNYPSQPMLGVLDDDRIHGVTGSYPILAVSPHRQPLGASPGAWHAERGSRVAGTVFYRYQYHLHRNARQPSRLDPSGAFCRVACPDTTACLSRSRRDGQRSRVKQQQTRLCCTWNPSSPNAQEGKTKMLALYCQHLCFVSRETVAIKHRYGAPNHPGFHPPYRGMHPALPHARRRHHPPG